MRPKNIVIPLVIYPFDIMFSFGETDKQLENRLSNHGVNVDEEKHYLFTNHTELGRTCVFSGGQTLIRMKRLPQTCNDFGTLQHEIFHSVEFLMERIGVKHSVDCGECYAYLIGYITEQVYKTMNL